MPSDHHPCSRWSASGYCGCRYTVPRHEIPSTQYRAQISYFIIRASIYSIQHVQQLLRQTEPLESLLSHSEVFFFARELEILQRSIHPSQTPTKARNRQKEVTETKMGAAKQEFPRREATKLTEAKRR